MKRILFLALIFQGIITGSYAQSQELTVASLRNINHKLIRAVEDLEIYSTFSTYDDHVNFNNLFIPETARVYCDIPFDDTYEEDLGVEEYSRIVKNNCNDLGVFIRIIKIHLPQWDGKKGLVDVEVRKSIEGINRCENRFNDESRLLISYELVLSDKGPDLGRISQINAMERKGKLLTVKVIGPKSKSLPGESFLFNDSLFVTDKFGNISFRYHDKSVGLRIDPVNKDYAGPILFADIQELMTQSLPGDSPCSPRIVTLTLQNAEIALAQQQKAGKEEKQKQREAELALLAEQKQAKEKAEAEKKEIARLEKEKNDQERRTALQKQEKEEKVRRDQLEKEVLANKVAETERVAREKADAEHKEELARKARLEKEALARKEQQEEKAMVKKDDSKQEKQGGAAFPKFSVGVLMNYIPPLSDSPVKGDNTIASNTIDPKFSVGMGISAGYNFKLGGLGMFKLNTGVVMEKINFSSTLDKKEEFFGNEIDLDEFPYERRILMRAINDDVKLAYITVPVELEKVFNLGGSGWSISLDAGASLMFLSSASNSCKADAVFSGLYDFSTINENFGQVLISENGIYDFGTFQVTSTDRIEAVSQVACLDFGAGFSKAIGEKLNLHAGYNYRMSMGDLFQPKIYLSVKQSNSQMESLMSLDNKYKFQYGCLSLGLSFNF